MIKSIKTKIMKKKRESYVEMKSLLIISTISVAVLAILTIV